MTKTFKFGIALAAAALIAMTSGMTGMNGVETVRAVEPTPTPPLQPTPESPSDLRSNIKVFKNVSKSTAQVGDEVTFVISVLCEGNTFCGNVTMNDSVPANFTVLDASASSGTLNRSGQSISWSKGLMEQREQVNITVRTKAATAGCACNVAQGSASAPNNPNDDRGEACVCVGSPNTPVPPAPLPVTGTQLPIGALVSMAVGLTTALAVLRAGKRN
jgi:uncharacterized repeat protein (TIGR01451 family)